MLDRRWVASLPVLVLILACPAISGAGAIMIFAAVTQGSYGGESDSDVQATRFSFITGDLHQFRGDLGFLRARQGSLLASSVGPIPPKPRGHYGPVGQSPQPSDGQSDQGSGPGSGNDPDPEGFGEAGGSEILEGAEWQSGLGDIRIAASRRILGGGAKVFRLDLGGQVKAPTADADKGLGTGEWDGCVGITSEYRFWTTTGFGGIGWNYLGDPSWVELNDVVDGYVGLESEPLAHRVIVSGWVEGNPEVIEGLGARAALGVGLRTIGKLRWRVLATIGLTDAAQDFSLVVGTSFGVPTPTVGTRGPVR